MHKLANSTAACRLWWEHPGARSDLIKRKKLNVTEIRWVVLDEADEMLSMGFKDDLDAILKNSPKEKQTMLFSATMPNEIVSISKKYMTDIHEISVGKEIPVPIMWSITTI